MFLLPGNKTIGMAVVLAWAVPAWSADAPADQEGFQKAIAPFFKTHCVQCHGPKKAKGKLTLHDIDTDVASGKQQDAWQKIAEQLEFSEMPPEEAKTQPGRNDVKKVIRWIGGELKAAGKLLNAEVRRHDPAYGNHIDHDQLFSGQHKGPAYSPSRLWRMSPFISIGRYKNRDQLGRHLHQSSQPFSVSDKPGIKDYAMMWRLDGPTLELLLLNADEVVKNQIGLSPEAAEKMDADYIRQVQNDPKLDEKKKKAKLRKKPSQNLLRWSSKEVRVFAYGTGEPKRETMASILKAQYRAAMLREPTTQELARSMELFAAAIKEGGRLEGARAALTAVLMKPEAIYRMELGLGKKMSDGRRMLSSQELALALSYALRDMGPDKEIRADADSGKLLDRAVIAKHVDRMIETEFGGHYRRVPAPRYWRFFEEFFGFTTAPTVFKDGSRHPGYNAPQPDRLVDDTRALIQHVVKKDKDVLKNLLTTDEVAVYTFQKSFRLTYMAYGVDRKTVLELSKDKEKTGQVGNGRYIFHKPGERAGILTQPAWLMAHSQTFDNDVVHRGKWVYQRLLAGTIPDVPITVDAAVPADHDKSLRQRMQKTRENYCWKCHRKMDSYGLVFESFDDVGRFRTKELLRDNKTKVDVQAHGEIVASGVPGLDGPVKNVQELMQKLGASPRVRQSFVRHAFRYYMGRNETFDDSPTLMAADKAYVESGGSMKALVVSLLTSDSFLYRKDP